MSLLEWFIALPLVGKVTVFYCELLVLCLIALLWMISTAPMRQDWAEYDEKLDAAEAQQRQRRLGERRRHRAL